MKWVLSVAFFLGMAFLADAATVRFEWDYTHNPEKPAVQYHLWATDCVVAQAVAEAFIPVSQGTGSYVEQGTLTSLAAGKTYCAAVTAMDAAGKSSEPSNTVRFQTPEAILAVPGNLRLK